MLRVAVRLHRSARFSCSPSCKPMQPTIRFYCSDGIDDMDEENYQEYLDDSGKEEGVEMMKSQRERWEKNTHLVSRGDKKLRILNQDAPSSDPESEFTWDDVDSNMDQGLYDDNLRYQRYNKNYDANAKKEREEEHVKLSGTVDQVDGWRRKRHLRDFHRHKVLTQTGRSVDLSKEGLQKKYEPGYNPDYLPRFFDVSDASEMFSEPSDDSESDLDKILGEQKTVSKYDKLGKKTTSPYFTTQRRLEQTDESDQERKFNIKALEEGLGDDGEPGEGGDDGAEGGGGGNEVIDDDGEDENTGSSDWEPEKREPHATDAPTSSTEDCPSDIYDDLDLSQIKGLPPPEHDVLHRTDFMHQMLIKTGRHCKVTTGGRIFSTSALVLIGNGDGIGGLGYGKGESISDALSNALKDAKRKLFVIHRVDNSLSYQSKQKYCRARVYVWPLAKKMGTRGSYKHQELLDLLGLTDIRIKTFGRRNDHNIYKALIRCLQTSETPEMCARRRGKKVWDINKYWRVNNRSKAY